MKIITKTLLTIIAILFANACATTTSTTKSLVGEYQCDSINIKYIIRENGRVEVLQILGKASEKVAEHKWEITNGELLFKLDVGTTDVFRIYTNALIKQNPTLFDKIVKVSYIDKAGNRKDFSEQLIFKKIK